MSNSGILLVLSFFALLVIGGVILSDKYDKMRNQASRIYEVSYVDGMRDTIITSRNVYLTSRGCLHNGNLTFRCGVKKFHEIE